MVPLGFDPEGVPSPSPAVTPTQASAPISSVLLKFSIDIPSSAFRILGVPKSICFLVHHCLEIACEEIPGPGSYKEESYAFEGC